MDWTAFALSLKLACWTTALLAPIGIWLARVLAFRARRSKTIMEALVALPLVLPPTVLGYYLLVSLGGDSLVGRLYTGVVGHGLVFTFQGLLLASVLINLPFAVQPMQRAFEALPPDVREAAWVSGLTPAQTFWRIELPLAWPGVLSAFVLTFAHTMGEFGVVLMIGGSIPGETKTAALAIYDRVQAFDQSAAGIMSAALVIVSVVAIVIAYAATGRVGRRHE
ncbi:MAG: molybdate ABC transporter permease subunit [Gemmatimonadaceae bacterium]|nr:molybdate ABC transporter permease subunit [Gemmatimonadaceae bacterium]